MINFYTLKLNLDSKYYLISIKYKLYLKCGKLIFDPKSEINIVYVIQLK